MGMMEDLGISSLNMDWGGWSGQIWTGFIWLLIMLVVIAIVVWWLWMRQFNKKVRLRVLTGTKKIIRDYKAREIVVHGVKYWMILKNPVMLWKGDLLPVPPSDAIEISAKGQMIVEAYFTELGEYQFIEDKGAANIRTGKDFMPLTTNQRLMLIDQCVKANSKRPLNWTEHIPAIAGVTGLVIMIIVVFVFWENITAPALAAQQTWKGTIDTQAKITADQREIIEIWREIKFNQQRIIAEDEATGSNTPPN